MLKKVGVNIWTVSNEVTFMKMRFISLSTIVKLSAGNLWIHSPVKLTQELKQELEKISEAPIKTLYLIAPNTMHHIFINSYLSDFPNECKIYGPKLLQKKNKELKFEKFLTKDDSNKTWDWSDEIESQFIDGIPLLSETIFFHKKSKTLIICDLLAYVTQATGFFGKLYFIFSGLYKKINVNKPVKMMLRDKEKTLQSLENVFKWDFDRIHVCHDTPIEKDQKGKEKFIQLYNKLLK